MPWDIKKEKGHLTTFTPAEGSPCRIREADAIREEGRLSFTIAIPDPQSYQILYQFFEFHPEFGFAQHHSVFMTDISNFCSLTVEEESERDVLLRFIDELTRFEPMLTEIVPDIKTALHYRDKKPVYEDLLLRFAKDNFIMVLLNARKLYKQGFRDVYHVLANRCFETGHDKEGVLALHLIPTDDALGHFRAAEIFRRMVEGERRS